MCRILVKLKGVCKLLKKMIAFIFIFYLPNFILAGEPQALIEENFGERFYGVYAGGSKVGYLIHEISQTEDKVIQDVSMNMRMILSEEEKKEHKAKYALSQIFSQHQFYKETGLLSEVTKADGKRYFTDYESLLENKHFKQEISTLIAKFKGDFSYEVLTSNQDGESSKLLKLPSLHMYDFFAEINFVLSNPDIGETRAIEVFDLDFENEVFTSATLILKQKERAGKGLGSKYKYVIQVDLDDESFTYFVDQYGNIIGAEMFGLDLIREPKEQALALDAKNI